MSVRELFTFLVVSISAASVAIMGMQVLRFEAIDEATQTLAAAQEERSDDQAQDAAAEWRRQVDETLREAARWTSTPGLRSRAREAVGVLQALSGAETGYEDNLISYLEAEPTSGRHWLDLAKARWRRGAESDEVLGPLQMSYLTEPLEIETMFTRTLFIIRIWEQAPTAERRVATTQLATIIRQMTIDGIKRTQTVLLAKSDAARTQIREALLTHDPAIARWLKRIGL